MAQPKVTGSQIDQTNLDISTMTGVAASATVLATARAIYGNNFDGSTALTQIIASTFGGTGNGFTKFTGPTTTEKTFTLPDSSAVILTDNTDVTVAQGGTGVSSFTAYSVICGGTTASGALQNVSGLGNSGQVLTSAGASALPTWEDVIISATVTATTSGTTKDFSSLPTGIKRIRITLDGVSTNTGSHLLIQIGDGSGGLKTSAYVSSSAWIEAALSDDRVTSTAGFVVYSGAGTRSHIITIDLTLHDSANNIWLAKHVGDNGSASVYGGGRVALTAPLDRVRLTTVNGTDTFDAGSWNIHYE